MDDLEFDDEWGAFADFCVDMFKKSIKEMTTIERRQLMSDFGHCYKYPVTPNGMDIARRVTNFVFENYCLMKTVSCELDRLCTECNVGTSSFNQLDHFKQEHSNCVLPANLTISSSPSKGRHIVTSRDIKPNSTVLVQKAYIAWLKPSVYESYCYSCHRRLDEASKVTCPNCSSVAFCSHDCEATTKTIHCQECPAIRVLKPMSTGHMALQFVLKQGIDSVIRKDYYDTEYEHVCRLIDHMDKYDTGIMLCDTMGAILITLIAQRIGLTSCLDSAEHAELAAVILRHTYQIGVNGMQIVSVDPADRSERSVGVAIYPHACLLNHACYSQLKVGFAGNTLVLKSRTRVLTEGTELTFNYGPHFKTMKSREERIDFLKNFYYFNCECLACVNDWQVETT